jgi:signal transduction histidine kinase
VPGLRSKERKQVEVQFCAASLAALVALTKGVSVAVKGEEEPVATISSHNARSGTPIRWRSLVGPAVVGFLLGYVLLHPVSMMVFEWLDPRIAAAAATHGSGAGGMGGPIMHSFHLSMLPMGLVFGVIGAVITISYGLHRLALMFQRDLLAQQLARNEQLCHELADQAELLRQNNEELAKLELSNRRTSQFMAHDFKNALGCVGGFAAQLLEHPRLPQDRDIGDALVCIRRQAHRMMGSVTDLLDFARVREGSGPKMESVSATDLLQDAVSDFSLPAHSERVAIGDNHADCPPLLADPRLLRRVLCNLISNSFKHNGPDTSVWLDIRVDEPCTEATFSCSDDGDGIPPEVLPSVFTEFTTADGTSGESSGLGLAFCKVVVETHGGCIWCENSKNGGAQFYFTIPLRKELDNDESVCNTKTSVDCRRRARLRRSAAVNPVEGGIQRDGGSQLRRRTGGGT